jgi:HPt (histidine-containing phosphotransfer) domain-containing protein
MGLEPPVAVIDMAQLRNITLDDEELMKEIVAALVVDATSQIGKLGEALDRADAGECVRVAHSARGACGNVGAVSLAALFSSIEQDARGGNLPACRSNLLLLHQELDRLRNESQLI